MNYLNLWGATIVASLQNLWIQLLGFLPQILGAIIVLIVGVIVAGMLGKLAARVIAMAKVDNLVQSTGVTDEFRKIGISFSLSKLLGWIVKWFLIIATLIAVVDILNIGQVTLFLQDVALYIPNVIAAIVILTIGIVAGNFVRQVVHKAAEASKIPATAAGPLSAVAKWSIIIFALLAALVQLHVAAALIQTLFTGFIAMLAIAGGLAFGLGGQDKARAWLDRLDREIRS
ncbi:hypothetical protein KJZ71_05560 [Patescibacteria group bacterium]|nr:hypothetical protein [Patescibacteria group bacterium]MDL1953310.1 hypothetical protein [Candidatus Uhrbacteria bacterium UHB]RIL00539.1 MAG: hypothetical protein DCC77_03195 [Candidatus Uhrbacteria bacterium]